MKIFPLRIVLDSRLKMMEEREDEQNEDMVYLEKGVVYAAGGIVVVLTVFAVVAVVVVVDVLNVEDS